MKKAFHPLVIGNWKMNPLSMTAATKLYKSVIAGVSRTTGVAVVVTPPALYLLPLAKLSKSKKVTIGAQNAYWGNIGAHTGEISCAMYTQIPVSHVIVGHSERRAEGETDAMVNKKVHATLKAGITPVVCVGEAKRDTHGRYFGHIETQVIEACRGVTKSRMSSMVFAYEPIWAIGTGNTATPGDAHEMKLFIQKVLVGLYGRNVAAKVKILYGGSVNPKNAAALMEDGQIDGFLVGGASLRAQDFIAIVNTARTYGTE
ncbi:MAG: triose-phosphate isomerase [Candidatus Pacebacteria bacterium]|nr:triose-phosphate isomerase [Candidatus Paceibacterota bacterium]